MHTKNTWDIEIVNDITNKMLLFIFSPFLSFIYSLRRINTRSSYWIFFLFAICFGLSFTVANERIGNSLDGIHYRILFESFKYVDLNLYFEGLMDYLSYEGEKDYFVSTLFFFVSRITDNYHVMFMFSSVIFASFSLVSFKYLTNESNFNNSFPCLILSFLFMYNSIFNINGLRFWTAAWVAVFCIFKIVRDKKYAYFLLAIFTPFIHISYWIYILLLLLYMMLGRFEKMWIICLISSFLLSNFLLAYMQEFISLLPSSLANNIAINTDAEYMKERETLDSSRIVGDFFAFLINVFLAIIMYLFVKNRELVKSNPKVKSLYFFLLIWMSFCFAAMPIPSLGNRFVILSYPFIAYIWLAVFGTTHYRKILYCIPGVFSYNIYILILNYLQVLDWSFFISNPISLISKYLM